MSHSVSVDLVMGARERLWADKVVAGKGGLAEGDADASRRP